MDRLVVVDASFDCEAGMAGIAAVSLEPAIGLVGLEVMEATSSTYAEGLAAMRAIAYLAGVSAPPGSRVFTDSRQMVKAVRFPKAKPKELAELAAELRAMVVNHDYVYEDRGRATVQQAHNASRQALKSWLAGREERETWKRPIYSKAARETAVAPHGPFADLGRRIEEAAADERAALASADHDEEGR